MSRKVIVIGAGIGGLTTAVALASQGYDVEVFEAQTYPGGSASTFVHKGYRFESGATVVGGFQENGPHYNAALQLGVSWKVKRHDPAWVVHLPDKSIALTLDHADVISKFPETAGFWRHQASIARQAWKMSADGLPWPPADAAELAQLVRVGLRNFPGDVAVAPFALMTVKQWLRMHGLAGNRSFIRFLDASLLISAQTTTAYVNALYGATALYLSRQGVYHAEGGIGGIAESLVERLKALGGRIHYRRFVRQIVVQGSKATGILFSSGRRATATQFAAADWVVVNNTPWALLDLLADAAPSSLRREAAQRSATQGAFVLHMGVRQDCLPTSLAEHHQIVETYDGPMGEGHTVFVSLSPTWDKTRAPEGYRAVTVSTHTRVDQWWQLFEQSRDAYNERKQAYARRILSLIDRNIPGFSRAADLVLPGTPLTYEFYTLRPLGMVGGFPQTSLFRARNPRTGIRNVRLVGDSIFPGQSTAGVTLGAMRVAEDIRRHLPLPTSSQYPRIVQG
jgi:C-3',4' desaturase CrtD